MLTAVHTIVYADDAERARAFFRDVLGWPHVDAGGGWLLFRTGPSELGVHPTSAGPKSETAQHEIALMCDDLDATMAELAAEGVEFTAGVEDAGFGRLTRFAVPGAGEMLLYQAAHPPAYDL